MNWALISFTRMENSDHLFEPFEPITASIMVFSAGLLASALKQYSLPTGYLQWFSPALFLLQSLQSQRAWVSVVTVRTAG